jgi:hypothetical protein
MVAVRVAGAAELASSAMKWNVGMDGETRCNWRRLETDECEGEESRLKAGCSQDWPGLAAPQSGIAATRTGVASCKKAD